MALKINLTNRSGSELFICEAKREESILSNKLTDKELKKLINFPHLKAENLKELRIQKLVSGFVSENNQLPLYDGIIIVIHENDSELLAQKVVEQFKKLFRVNKIEIENIIPI